MTNQFFHHGGKWTHECMMDSHSVTKGQLCVLCCYFWWIMCSLCFFMYLSFHLYTLSFPYPPFFFTLSYFLSIPQTAVMASPGINTKALHNSTAASIMCDATRHSGRMPSSVSLFHITLCLCLSSLRWNLTCTAICINDKCEAFNNEVKLIYFPSCLCSFFRVKRAFQPRDCSTRCHGAQPTIQNVTESNKNRVIQQAVESSCLTAAISIGAKRIIVAMRGFIQI